MPIIFLITLLQLVIYDSLSDKLKPCFLFCYVIGWGIYLDYHPTTENLEWIIFMLFISLLIAIYKLIQLDSSYGVPKYKNPPAPPKRKNKPIHPDWQKD